MKMSDARQNFSSDVDESSNVLHHATARPASSSFVPHIFHLNGSRFRRITLLMLKRSLIFFMLSSNRTETPSAPPGPVAPGPGSSFAVK